MKKIINLTPHAIHLPGRTVLPSGVVARCRETTNMLYMFDDVALVTKQYGDVFDLPEPKNDTLYIVSMMVREACPDRSDVASPGDLVRDDDGKIIGAKNLVVNETPF